MASDFTYGGVALPGTKVDLKPIPVGFDINYWAANDGNQAFNALNSLRSAALSISPGGVASTYTSPPAVGGLLVGNIASGQGITVPAIKVGNTNALSGVDVVMGWYLDNNVTQIAYMRQDGYLFGAGVAALGSNVSMSIRGNATDGASAVGVKVGNLNALANATAKVLDIFSDNLATEIAYVDKSGSFSSASGVYKAVGTNISATIQGSVSAAQAQADVIVNSLNTRTAGSILSIQNNGVQKAFFDYNGVLVGPDAFQRTTVADANYSTVVNDALVAYTSITVARTVTLTHPANIGHVIVVKDESGSVTGTITITVTDSGGSGNMQGGANQVINAAFGVVRLYWNGSKWFVW